MDINAKKSWEDKENKLKQEIIQMQEKLNQKEDEKKRMFEEQINLLRQEIQQIKEDQNNQLKILQQKEEVNKKNYEDEIIQLKQEIQQIKEYFNKQHEIQKQEIEDNLKEMQNKLNQSCETQKIDMNSTILKIYNLQKKFDDLLLLINNFLVEFFKEKELKTNINKININISNLLTYLEKETNQSKGVFLLPEKEINQTDLLKRLNLCSKIGLSKEIIEKLYENNQLKLLELMKHIDNFSEFQIEIKYLSEKFEEIYKQIKEIKNLVI